MSLDTNIQDLATRMGTEAKALRALINGNLTDLSGLNTTAKNNLVAAINEVLVNAGSGSGDLVSTNNLSDVADPAASRTNLDIFSQAEVTAAIAAAVAGVSLAGLGGLTQAEVDARAQVVLDANVGAAPGALDTIQEIANALQDNPDVITDILTAQSNRLRFDAAQVLDAVQQTQAQDNMQVYSRTDIGSITTNYVTIFETALV